MQQLHGHLIDGRIASFDSSNQDKHDQAFKAATSSIKLHTQQISLKLSSKPTKKNSGRLQQQWSVPGVVGGR